MPAARGATAPGRVRVSNVASENVELVRSILAASARGDYSPVYSGETIDWAHPEIEFVIADGPHPGSWKGVAGMAEAMRDFLSAWEEYRVEAEEFRELDRERVLVFIRRDGRGKTSGLELGQVHAKGANLFHIRDGLVTRLVAYWHRERALADLGLPSETGSGLQ